MRVNHMRVGWGIIISQTDLGINQQWNFFCGQTVDFSNCYGARQGKQFSAHALLKV